ncbi:Transcription factor AP-2 [Aphelenchoides besseyi]|nr:Transcription factor AP-2 [Aphelenchoides besseyi]
MSEEAQANLLTTLLRGISANGMAGNEMPCNDVRLQQLEFAANLFPQQQLELAANLLQQQPLALLALMQQFQTAGMPQVQAADQEPQTKLTALELNIEQPAIGVKLEDQPHSAVTSVDEGVITSSTSPTETASGTPSPRHANGDEGGLPKESEQQRRKRPSAIHNLLSNTKKKPRLDSLVDWQQTKPESEQSHNSTGQLDNVPEDWTPTNNEVYESPDAGSIPYDKQFAMVPGRLSLLSNVMKYQMTVGEVRRRLLGPEAFNFSLLGALLRRAKMPDKSQELLKELRSIGLAIPRGRRRAEKVTLMSALTESEAAQFSRDFLAVSETHFPIKEFAVASIQQAEQNKQLNEQFIQLVAASKIVDEFTQLLEMDRSEIRDTKPTPIFPPQIQEPLSVYSMLTHGFGNPGLLVGVKIFRKFIDEQMQVMRNKIKP